LLAPRGSNIFSGHRLHPNLSTSRWVIMLGAVWGRLDARHKMPQREVTTDGVQVMVELDSLTMAGRTKTHASQCKGQTDIGPVRRL
jgi:hypothetical protein